MAGAVVVQGLRDLAARGPGYQATGVLTAQIRLPEAAYRSPESRTTVVNRLLDEIRALPGVESAGITQNAFLPNFSYQTLLKVKDRPTPNDQPHTVQYRRVSPDYFAAMRITTIAGRVFTDGDTADRPQVAIISHRFAKPRLLDPGRSCSATTRRQCHRGCRRRCRHDRWSRRTRRSTCPGRRTTTSACRWHSCPDRVDPHR
jgi:hypothetical protein